MNAEDRWAKLIQRVPNTNMNTKGVISDWIEEARDIGHDMATTIEALRELNVKQFQEIGRLQKLVRQYGGQEEND